MSELQNIERTLDQTVARIRWIRAWQGAWRGLAAGGGVYLAGLAAYKLAPVPWGVVEAALVAAGVCVGAGLFWGLSRRVTREDAARFLDARAGLKERLSTALEVTRQGQGDRWSQLVVADAGVAASTVSAKRVLPFSLPGFARWVVLTLALGAGLGFIPEYRTKAQQQQAEDAAVIKDTGKNLVQVTKRQIAERKPAMEETKKAIDDVSQLGDRLQNAKLSRDDALRDLAKATESMKQQALELAKNPALRKLEQAARNNGTSPTQNPAALQNQIDALQKALGNKADQGEAIQDMKKQLEKLKEDAKGLANKDGAEAKEARSELSKSLSELARQAEAMDMPMDSLAEAAEALRNADVDQFLKDLGIAEKDLEKLADMAKQLAKMQAQAEKMGKDLAEQLKNGQAEAAVDTLQKMIKELQMGNLSKEQMEKIAQEASKASKAGDQYGKVGEMLKKAAGQCQGGDKQGGAQSLAAAQKELQELMDQMGDAQAMMSALQSLQKAQVCIGNGQCWGRAMSKSATPRAGQKSKGGRGVGTWSENDAWSMPDSIDDLWDNSGINRPDMAGKGQTERDINRPDTLVPTKVKGQLQPGGPMPSITLKGVSAKGESRVQYAEAVATAQSDAQAALNQEQVPKAYKNAVRDYFDDIKK